MSVATRKAKEKLLAGLLLIVGCGVAGAADKPHKGKFFDEATGFQIDLRRLGRPICHAYPANARDPRQCDAWTLQNPKFYGQMMPNRKTISISYVEVDSKTVAIITTSKLIAEGEVGDASVGTAHEIIDGAQRGLRDHGMSPQRFTGTKPGTDFDLISVNGIPAIRYVSQGIKDKNGGTTVTYALFGKHALASVSVGGRDVDLERLVRLSEVVVAHVHLPPHSQDLKGFKKL